jgi:thiol:disulfide interchange protein DsbD
MSFARVVLLFFAGLIPTQLQIIAAPQAVMSPASIVKPSAFVSLDPVPRGTPFEVAIVIEIANGFHMNSNQPSESYLIPTTLTPQIPAGFRFLKTIYPAGRLEKFVFSPDKPLNVYTGKAKILLQISADSAAPLGAVAISAVLRYQACNSTTCLQPVKVPVSIKLNVAAAGARPHAVHPDLFK